MRQEEYLKGQMDVPYYSIKHIKDAHLIQFSGLFFLVHYKNQVAVAKIKKKKAEKVFPYEQSF